MVTVDDHGGVWVQRGAGENGVDFGRKGGQDQGALFGLHALLARGLRVGGQRLTRRLNVDRCVGLRRRCERGLELASRERDHNDGVSAGAPGALLAANGLRKLRSRFDTTAVITRTGSTATAAAAAGARCETSVAAVGPRRPHTSRQEYRQPSTSPTTSHSTPQVM